MAEYIERQKAIDAYLNLLLKDGEIYTTDVTDVLQAIPAADVQPAKHGTWVYNPEDNIPYCSECMMPQDSECNYCPSCGAKMGATNG